MMKRGLMGIILAASVTACSSTDDSLPEKGLQLIRPGVPTGTVTLKNKFSFTIGVVTIGNCEMSEYVQPQPQVIEPGASATYTLSAGCYRIVAGEAGLSFNYATDEIVRIEKGSAIVLPR